MIRGSHRLRPGATVIETLVLLKKEKNYEKKKPRMKQIPWCGHLPQILLDCSNLDRDLYLTVGFGTQ